MIKPIFIFLLLCNMGYGLSDRSQVLFNKMGEPSNDLLELLCFIQVEHDGSWGDIVAQTQKLLRAPNQELWEVTPRDDLPLDEAYAHFRRLGMIDSIIATKKEYRYAAVFGSSLEVMRSRLLFLKQEWDRGVRFKELILLAGQRERAPFENTTATTETEMMIQLFEQMDLPQEWKTLPLVVIDSPIPEGKPRPQTKHQLSDWMEQNPEPGSVLFVSSQPFVGRQDATARNHIPFPLETIGMGVDYAYFCEQPLATSIFIETLTRWIYEAVVIKDSCFLKESQSKLKTCGTITSASTKSIFPQSAVTLVIDPQKVRAAVSR